MLLFTWIIYSRTNIRTFLFAKFIYTDKLCLFMCTTGSFHFLQILIFDFRLYNDVYFIVSLIQTILKFYNLNL